MVFIEKGYTSRKVGDKATMFSHIIALCVKFRIKYTS
jgi:hypothetical protein